MIVELEQLVHEDLGEPTRSECFTAYVENADGFTRCVESVAAAVQRGGSRNPFGLLRYKVREGEHRRQRPRSLAAASPAARVARADDECRRCGQRAAISTATALCADCEGATA